MDIKTQVAVAELIRVMEKREQQVREGMSKKDDRLPKDRYMPGWAYGIHLSWEDIKADPEQGYEGNNQITCFFEYNGIHVSVHDMDEKTEVDLTFLTSDIFKNDIVPALREWAQNKVDAEPFGGLYGARFGITVTLSTHREVRANDPPHMQGGNWEQENIRVRDEKRLGTCRRMVHEFIANKGYLTEDIGEIDNSLPNICTHTVKNLHTEFGNETILTAFHTLLERAKEEKSGVTLSRLMRGFASAAALTVTEDGHTPSEQELALACEICILLLMHGTDKYEKDWGRTYLENTAVLGYKRAKDIMKFGTGQIPPEINAYKDKLVTCFANDIDKVVDIKIKEESAGVYIAIVKYLTRLIENGFPGEYRIKCNSKVKNFIPTQLKVSKTNNFFANAAGYPEAYEALKEYARAAFDDYNYYSDAEDEEAVTCGGYAAMALAFANPIANFDIGLEFIEHSDFEHAITSRYFVEDFAEVLKGENKKKVLAYMEEF